jgi:hypothetical protein
LGCCLPIIVVSDMKRKNRTRLTGRLAVLLGAGASRGAGGVTPHPPPLGSELFDQLALSYSMTWGRLSAPYKQLLRHDFEAGMAELWNTPDLSASPLFIDMSLYFTRFEPPADGRDRYSHLVEALKARHLLHRVAIATLNYECVLDIAASQAGTSLSYQSNDGKPPAGGLLILKPHGACNLLPAAKVITVGASKLIAAGGMSGFYDGDIEILESMAEVTERYAAGFGLPPVMSMYTRDKHSPVGRTFLDASRAQWRTWVRSCSAVLCVGARPVRWDRHVWGPIIERHATTWFVGGQDESYRGLVAELGPKVEYLGPTFAGASDAIAKCLDRFV